MASIRTARLIATGPSGRRGGTAHVNGPGRTVIRRSGPTADLAHSR